MLDGYPAVTRLAEIVSLNQKFSTLPQDEDVQKLLVKRMTELSVWKVGETLQTCPCSQATEGGAGGLLGERRRKSKCN